ncbi:MULTISPECIES: biotin transporter BioY [unclassified Roseitalea]|uniref:biotin transporter BioY n=1 Tax=unclassified Roseitalea TaxID=2639107 RepID=UPI00273E9215|nr:MULTISPECIES: biotin transporter BioY [unclassified Roseitalea]
MTPTIRTRPLIAGALPEQGALRIALFVLIALAGSWLLAISGQFKVPFYPVPTTMQTFAAIVIGATFGARLGLATGALFLAQGAAGLPVFAGGGGLAYLAGPTGGYLVGFAVAAWLVGLAADRGVAASPFKLFAASIVGAVVILAMGYAWLATLIGAQAAWVSGVMPFLLGDLVKCVLAAALVPAAAGLLQRR